MPYFARLQDPPIAQSAPEAGAAAPVIEATEVAPRPARPWWLFAALGVGVLALVETVVALVAPLRAPKDADWRAAASTVRAGFRPGDLIVAAPQWADPILRMHLGDLIPLPVAARMDAARFGRVWELDQRGARAPEARDGRVTSETRHGALTVRLVEKTAAAVSYDFVERWAEAQVFRVDGGESTACPKAAVRFACGDVEVAPKTAEVDTRIRRGLMTHPVQGAVTAIEYAAVPLGRELMVATGLHNVWARKYDTGTVDVRVLLDGRPVLQVNTANNDGWKLSRIDTSAHAGRTARVRFEVSSTEPRGRHLVIAAEARS